jgi:hypothetical protein
MEISDFLQTLLWHSLFLRSTKTVLGRFENNLHYILFNLFPLKNSYDLQQPTFSLSKGRIIKSNFYKGL